MQNFKIYELIEQDYETIETYNQLFQFVPSSNVFLKHKAKEIELMSFGEVAELKKRALNEEVFYLLRTVFEVTDEQILKCRVTDFFPARNYVNEKLVSLIKREKMLYGQVDPKLMKAGIERLNILGDQNVLIDIGEQFGVRPSEVDQWPYAEIFSIRLKNKIVADIERSIK